MQRLWKAKQVSVVSPRLKSKIKAEAAAACIKIVVG